MGPRRNTTTAGKRAGLPFRDDLPAVSSSRLRRAGAITPHTESVRIFDREVGVTHRQFPNGGSWSFFLCPACNRRARILRLFDERVLCMWCDGLLYRCQAHDKVDRIGRLRQALYGPNKSARRKRLEIALRRALLAERRKWL